MNPDPYYKANLQLYSKYVVEDEDLFGAFIGLLLEVQRQSP